MTVRNYTDMIALLPDNTTGLISAQDLRDLVDSIYNIGQEEAVGTNLYRTNDGQPAGVSIKGSAGVVYGVVVTNISDSFNCFVKLYNKATAPLATDTPFLTVGAGLGQQIAFTLPQGVSFSNGIGIRVTSGWQDNDASGATAGSFNVNVLYL